MTSHNEVFLGIDLGTTRTKAGLIAADGTPLGFGRSEHQMRVDPAVGFASRTGRWWAGLGRAVG